MIRVWNGGVAYDPKDDWLTEMANDQHEKIKQLWNGIGILRAALTDEQRRRVARICYETQGVCFCGCHETDFEAAEYANATTGNAGKENP